MFQKEIMSPEEAAAIVKNATLIARANIADKISQRPFSVQVQTLTLTTAVLETNPYKISTSFKSLYIQDATDVYVSINVRFNSRDTVQGSFSMKKNDAITLDEPTNEAYLHWSAQSGKTITLVIFTDAAFQSGSQISVTGGGVSIVDGSTITGPTRVVLGAATAGIIAPANTLRKKCTLQNKTGASLYIGDSTVTGSGATEGIEIVDKGIIYWQNTGALYGFSTAGGNVHYVEEA